MNIHLQATGKYFIIKDINLKLQRSTLWNQAIEMMAG